MALKTKTWDVTEHLGTEEAIAGYIEAVLEDGDPALLAAAVGDVARARGMSLIADEMGMSRQSLYDAVAGFEGPKTETNTRILVALARKMAVAAE